MKKEKLLIICYGFNGSKSNNANALCLYESLDSLKQEFDIEIITGNIDAQNPIKKIQDKVIVHDLPITKVKNGKLNFNYWKKNVLKYIEINKLYENKKILTISFPFPVQLLGQEIKKQYADVKWYSYELDPYAYNQTPKLSKLYFLPKLFLEMKSFKHADKIFLTHELYTQYSSNILNKYNTKLYDIGIPLLEFCNESKLNYKPSNYNFIYSGSFYKRIRNPQYMFNVFEKLLETIPGKLHIYGINKKDTNKNYTYNSKCIKLNERISHDELKEYITKSDVLVNIGNNISNQLPSKILNYIGTGKPIINFYRIKNDTSKYYLDKYPNAISLDENENLEVSIKKIKKFIHQGFHSYSKEEYQKLFSYEVKEAVISRLVSQLRD